MLANYYPWKGRNNEPSPVKVSFRRRQGREKRWAILAVTAAALFFSISAADMFVGPDVPDAQEYPEPGSTPEALVEPSAATPAAVVTPPLPVPKLLDAGAANPARTSLAVPQPLAGADNRSLPPGAIAPRVNSPEIRRSDPGGYVIQVAAAPQLLEAQAVLAQLTEAGHPAHLTTVTAAGVEVYRVRVGPFKSRSEAEDIARRLEGEGHRAPWVTR